MAAALVPVQDTVRSPQGAGPAPVDQQVEAPAGETHHYSGHQQRPLAGVWIPLTRSGSPKRYPPPALSARFPQRVRRKWHRFRGARWCGRHRSQRGLITRCRTSAHLFAPHQQTRASMPPRTAAPLLFSFSSYLFSSCLRLRQPGQMPPLYRVTIDATGIRPGIKKGRQAVPLLMFPSWQRLIVRHVPASRHYLLHHVGAPDDDQGFGPSQ